MNVLKYCGTEFGGPSLERWERATASTAWFSNHGRTEAAVFAKCKLASPRTCYAGDSVSLSPCVDEVPFLGLILVNEQGSCTRTSDLGRVLLVSCLDQLGLQSQGFSLKYTGWPQESWWGSSSRTSGLYKEETASCFFSTWMIFVDMPPLQVMVDSKANNKFDYLSWTLLYPSILKLLSSLPWRSHLK